MKAGLLLSAVASVTLGAGLGAQVTPPKADSTCTKYSDGRTECRVIRRGLGVGDSAFRRVFTRMDSAMEKRAALGLELRTTGTRRDTLGVFVEAVTPQGPAEAAGIVEGDRIAAINGVDLRTSAADTEDYYTNGLASHRLTREVQKLAPGTRVTLRVYSGGRFRDVQVTAGKASDVMRLGNRFNFRAPGGGMMEFDGPGAMMFGQLNNLGPGSFKQYGDWTDRVAKGELPASKPQRPQGVERNIVVTLRDWMDDTHYLHDLISSDRRDPTVNANGPLYGSPEYSSDTMPILDVVENKATTFKLPVNAVIFRTEGVRVAVVDANGRVTLQPVTLGRDYGNSLEVVSGITGNERIIVNAPDSIEAGEAVRIAEVKSQ